MSRKVNIELFRFNAQTDYLPYYKKYTLTFDANTRINDLLSMINDQEAFGYKENGNLKVNHLYINAKEKVQTLVEQCGTDLRFDPISEFRAKKDLLIDNSDFVEKLGLLAQYLSAEEMVSYRQRTELIYYASNTLKHHRDYIGDHVLFIAAELLDKHFEWRNALMELVTDADNGVWFHTSLEHRLLDASVEAKIQKVCYLAERFIQPSSKLAKKVNTLLCSADKVEDEHQDSVGIQKVTQGFEGFRIAAYHGVKQSALEQLIVHSGASAVKLASSKDDLAAGSVYGNEAFSLKIASEVLLEAKDADADFVLVKNESMKSFFDQKQKKMEKLSGRDIGVSIISQSQFVQLLEGEKDHTALGFDQHVIKPAFLA